MSDIHRCSEMFNDPLSDLREWLDAEICNAEMKLIDWQTKEEQCRGSGGVITDDRGWVIYRLKAIVYLRQKWQARLQQVQRWKANLPQPPRPTCKEGLQV